MFPKFTLATGLLALSLFSYAQHHGWNLFDNVANSGSGGSGGSSRVYHK